MAVGSKYQDVHTLTCASSLSAASQQFTFVKLLTGAAGAGACGPVLADTDIPFGVLQNSPAVGEPAAICVAGFTKLRAGAVDIAALDRVASDATGRAIAVVAGTSVGYYPAGMVLHVDGADNDGGLVSVMIELKNPSRNN